MATPLLAPLTALHRPGQSLQQIVRKITPLSNPAGLFSVRAHATAPRATHPLSLLFDSPEDVEIFRVWYEGRYGALKAFWVPSYQQDLVPIGTIAADATEIDIELCGYSDRLFPLVERRAIIFLRVDGTFLKRDITAAVNNGDDTETITINEALGETFTQNNANGICFLWYGRLSDDVVKILWDTGDTASVDCSMVELLNPPLGGSGEGGPVSGTFPDPGD